MLAAAKKESEAFHAAVSHLKYLLNLRGNPKASIFTLSNTRGLTSYSAPEAAEKDEATCPICCDTLPQQRCVFRCAHVICPVCEESLWRQAGGVLAQQLSCPVCREPSARKDLRRVEMRRREPISALHARYGAKIAGLLDCLTAIRSQDAATKTIVCTSLLGLLTVYEGILRMARGAADSGSCSDCGRCDEQQTRTLHFLLNYLQACDMPSPLPWGPSSRRPLRHSALRQS